MPAQNNTAEVQTSSSGLTDWERLILQSAALKKLNAIHKEFREDMTKALTPGDKRAVKNAQGLELGSVTLTAPSKKAVCDDNAALLAMADEKGMEIVDSLPPAGDPRAQEIVNLLFEMGRTDLLDSFVPKEDADALAAEVLENWQITGELPLGWEIKDASQPSVRITPGRSKAAKAAIKIMLDGAGDALALNPGKDA